MLHDELEEAQAIHAGHFDIQSQDVRIELENLVARDVRIDGSADDFDLRVRAETVGQCFPDDC